MSLPVLAAETLHKTVWNPTILGILVVVFAVGLFCGSIYLLLATNMGARLGFLVAFTALMGFMVILTSLWVMTASPLNTLKGRIPAWEAKQIVGSLDKAKEPEVRSIVEQGRKANATEAANVKAAVDENLVQAESLPGEAAEPNKFARYQNVTEYKVLTTYEVGGSKPNPLDFELTHKPLFAVIEFCPVLEREVTFGVPPADPVCDKSENRQFLVLERDLGSLRIPPVVAFISSLLLFVLGLLGLHWYERDAQAVTRRGSLTPAPAGGGS